MAGAATPTGAVPSLGPNWPTTVDEEKHIVFAMTLWLDTHFGALRLQGLGGGDVLRFSVTPFGSGLKLKKIAQAVRPDRCRKAGAIGPVAGQHSNTWGRRPNDSCAKSRQNLKISEDLDRPQRKDRSASDQTLRRAQDSIGVNPEMAIEIGNGAALSEMFHPERPCPMPMH